MIKKAKNFTSEIIGNLLSKITGKDRAKNLGKKQIALQIIDILQRKKMNQKEFAALIKKNESEVSKYLSGKHNFTIDSLFALEYDLGERIILVPKFHAKETTCIIWATQEFETFTFYPHYSKMAGDKKMQTTPDNSQFSCSMLQSEINSVSAVN